MNELVIQILDGFDGGRWCLVLRETDDRTYEVFQSKGLQSGGYTWEAIAHALVALRAPELAQELDINAEGDEMYAYAKERAPLEAFEKLLVAAAADHSLLEAAMAHAGDDLE
jgi:hypothetical protein